MECEAKVKAMPYYKSWCPCKESSVISTLYETEFIGCAIPEEDWKKMGANDKKIIFYPTTTPLHEL